MTYTFAMQPSTPPIAQLRAECAASIGYVPAVEVTVPALGITGTLIAVTAPSVEGGETRYRVEWQEGARTLAAGFWLEDFDDESKVRLAAVYGVEVA